MIRISDKLQLIGSSFMAQGLRVLTTLAMARLLSPDDYGLYALILSMPAVFIGLGDFGIPTTLVQLKDDSEEAIIHTAFLLGTALYLVYGAVMIGCGAYLAVTRHDPRLVAVAGIVAVTSLLAEWYNIQLGVLNRRLHFRAEAKQNLIFSLSTALAGITFAFAGLGIFAIALQGLFGQLISNVVVTRFSKPSMPRRFSMKLAKRYMTLGGGVSLGLYLSNVQTSITNLVINHMAGQAALGMWNRTMQVVQLFGQNLLSSFERVLYPLLCRAEDDVERRRELLTRSILIMMLPSAFACAWLWAGREAAGVFLGPQWTDVPALLAVAALAIPAGVFGTVGYRTAYAMGRTSVMLKIGIADLVLFAIMLPIAWRYGTVGIAAAWVVSRYVLSMLMMAGIWRDTSPAFWPLVFRTAGLWLAATAAGAAMRLAGHALEVGVPELPFLVRFMVVSALAAIVYILLVYLTQPQLVRSAWNLSRGPARSAQPPAPTAPTALELDSNALDATVLPMESVKTEPECSR